ncbi:MAG: hypothetical protein IPO00_08800 [Betaproteobacteria bacterium]|nr:hypothetical protein [Betaproteobacteria bacterium]
MTPELAGLIGTLGGFVLAVLVVLYLHERREFAKSDAHERAALEREHRACERHDLQMRELTANRSMTLQAINQRARLESRATAIEQALADHADHLEALGRRGVARPKVGP